MLLKKDLEMRLEDMDLFAKTIGIKPFDIYLIGGSASVLGNYSDRGTRDFDFIDLNYSSKLGRVFRILGTFDFLEYESTILSPSYAKRAKKLDDYEYLNIYILAPEDLIVSKIIRLSKKDQSDIEMLLKSSDVNVIKQIIEEVLDREDLIQSKREGFIKKLKLFKEKFYV
ncbi:MAG: DUF6036 family nucleotidyltransferase [Bacillota bacterium]|nr:DUF6036 family nucleotidyltransferase [Bacillota bacterium]